MGQLVPVPDQQRARAHSIEEASQVAEVPNGWVELFCLVAVRHDTKPPVFARNELCAGIWELPEARIAAEAVAVLRARAVALESLMRKSGLVCRIREEWCAALGKSGLVCRIREEWGGVPH